MMVVLWLIFVATILLPGAHSAVPGCGRIEDIDDEMATAIFCPPVESEDPVDFYIASIVGGKPYQACGVLANASTLACQLTYLEEYTNYTATFVACRFPGNETSCGEAISTGFTTKLSPPTCVPWTSPDPNKLDVTVCSNGSAKHSIDAYTVVTYEAMIGFRFCTIIPAVPELKSCQLSELDAGTKYHVLVKALNKLAGVSSSASSIAMTTIPDDPMCFKVVVLPTETEIDVTLCRPFGNPALSLYEVEVLRDEGLNVTHFIPDDKLVPKQTLRISGLESASTYVVRARTCTDPNHCAPWVTGATISTPNVTEICLNSIKDTTATSPTATAVKVSIPNSTAAYIQLRKELLLLIVMATSVLISR